MPWLIRTLFFSVLLLTTTGCYVTSVSHSTDPQPTTALTNTSSNPGQGAVEPSVSVNRTTVLDNHVSFVLPNGYIALSSDEIKAQFSRGNPPQYVFANTSQTVSIAITLSADKLNPTQLHSFKDVMEHALESSIPDIVWIQREYITLSGREWIHFESITPAADAKFHNHIHFTSLDGHPLMINFTAVEDEYELVKPQLDTFRNSISFQK